MVTAPSLFAPTITAMPCAAGGHSPPANRNPRPPVGSSDQRPLARMPGLSAPRDAVVALHERVRVSGCATGAPVRPPLEGHMNITFAASQFPPLALGFFGLGVGYLIWGPQELLGFPARDERVDRALGVWGIWMPGLCQLVTGLILLIGLSWFEVFADAPILYMAALAFSAYGIHWLALGWNRYRGDDSRPNAGMSVAFTVLSALGVTVFFHAGDWPVGLLFVGLLAVYVCEFFVTLGVKPTERLLGLIRVVTGLWLMYLTFAVTLNFAAGFQLTV
jgi:hypothetical protein